MSWQFAICKDTNGTQSCEFEEATWTLQMKYAAQRLLKYTILARVYV